MCGIFGCLLTSPSELSHEVSALAHHAEQRGRDSSGLVMYSNSTYSIYRADTPLTKLVKKIKPDNYSLLAGHSRLITNSLTDNQPVLYDNVITLHNGIICNYESLWETLEANPSTSIDSEIIPAYITDQLNRGTGVGQAIENLFKACEGIVSSAVLLPERGTLLLISNNGSLYKGHIGENIYFASESWPLHQIHCEHIQQINGFSEHQIPRSEAPPKVINTDIRYRASLLPNTTYSQQEERLLEFAWPNIKRCSRCILPETMPYIRFDNQGVCNYCHNYVTKNHTKPLSVLEELIKPYRKKGARDCIVPFSGGRDSCYSLHLIVNELKMNPIAYTYDWGMVTELGRRNISRMCGKLGVENIIIAADIEKKRLNIHKNLVAWLKRPHLGMISILTAGDKHFFRHVETVKRQTNISLNLWGINPLEVTHFKTGFLGIPPSFENTYVYNSGTLSQLRYHTKRFYQMLLSPGYLNTSLIDTLWGEYWRSIHKKEDYYHVFDFWEWDEDIIDKTLTEYDWEWSADTPTSWRIGDATAAFYNYIYYTVAGFTEHDTFRSNQIREGALSRDDALALVKQENKPRYESIQWYLAAVNVDFSEAIRRINAIPKLYAP